MTPEFKHGMEDSSKEAENLKQLYKTIKEEDGVLKAEQTQKMRQINERLNSKSPRVRNSSPFY